MIHSPAAQFDIVLARINVFFKEKKDLILFLSVIALVAYGFELFNVNLTIDEEIHAFSNAPSVWIRQGRWGMYLLNKFLLPYTVIAVVPMFLALVFHIAAALLVMEAWNIRSKTTQMATGAVFVAFPAIAYMYTFSTISYGIGAGLFCTALSLFFYERLCGWKKVLAVFPAAFAVAIYQGFLVALAGAFLVCFILHQFEMRNRVWLDIGYGVLIVVAGAALYFVVHRLLISFFISESGYVDQYFDLNYLRNNLELVVTRVLDLMKRVYVGDRTVYGVQIDLLLALLGISVLNFVIHLLASSLTGFRKAVVFLLLLGFILLPFVSGVFTRGYLAMRFLVALPIVIAGLVFLGMGTAPKYLRYGLVVLAALCVLRFTVATNYLFSASHLALEGDRALAANLMMRIDAEKNRTGTRDIQYLEVIGYPSRPATRPTPKLETFGASFFEWTQGNAGRIILFLKILGYEDMSALPVERRAELIDQASTMAEWPQEGSVVILDDTVVIKFNPYSGTQRAQICANLQQQSQEIKDFCDG